MNHFKKYFFLVSLFVSCDLFAQELVIPPGSRFLITVDQSELQLERLIIGSDAIVEFSPGIDHWYVDAMHVEIGDRVVINATGQPGRSGKDGKSFAGLIANGCIDGQSGGTGVAGENGSVGVDIRLRVGLQAMGSVRIDTSGGSGGAGGNGGDGQAPSAKNCEKAKGGDGGNGGKGGDGGQAGNLRISWWEAIEGELVSADNVLSKFTLVANSGEGGNNGIGGKGGAGSPGKYVNKKSLAGNRKWVAGGGEGKPGNDGSLGESGRDGLIEFEKDALLSTRMSSSTGPVQPQPADTKSPSASEGDWQTEVQLLRSQIRTLQGRIDALEARQNN